MLARLNEVYKDGASPESRRLLAGMKEKFRKAINSNRLASDCDKEW